MFAHPRTTFNRLSPRAKEHVGSVLLGAYIATALGCVIVNTVLNKDQLPEVTAAGCDRGFTYCPSR